MTMDRILSWASLEPDMWTATWVPDGTPRDNDPGQTQTGIMGKQGQPDTGLHQGIAWLRETLVINEW